MSKFASTMFMFRRGFPSRMCFVDFYPNGASVETGSVLLLNLQAISVATFSH